MGDHTSYSYSVELFQESLAFIRKRITARPSLAIILGSGLGDFANQLQKKTVVPVESIPHYPAPTVEGHGGNLVFGKIGSATVLIFQGRIHFYEVGSLSSVLYPVHIAHGLEVRKLLVTNAAGGINKQFRPADLMLIIDHINLTFENPLNEFFHRRLNGMSLTNHSIYDSKLRMIIEQVAREKEIPLRRGVYCGVKGPSYETAAEVEMIRRIGGDAVGMSTVNETILAAHLGMRVAGISCITNLATGITSGMLSHSDVTKVAQKVKKHFSELLKGVIVRIGN